MYYTSSFKQRCLREFLFKHFMLNYRKITFPMVIWLRERMNKRKCHDLER